LLKESNVSKIRFWGKIYGIDADYYVIQGTMKDGPLPVMQPYVESKGNEGLNKYIFWVSSSILEDWYELPEVTNEHLMASWKFKYNFTGNLNAKVNAFNPFPGKESHLLKCQILRIMHSSWIVPDGYLRSNAKYEGDLQDKVTEFNDGFEMPSFEDLKAERAWVHEYAYINPKGKIIDTSEEMAEFQVERIRNIESDEGYKVIIEGKYIFNP
jgi:radial spoke head protein 4A